MTSPAHHERNAFRAVVRFIATGLIVGAMTLGPASPAEARQVPSIAEHTNGMTKIEGFFDLYWDDGTGKMFWEINNFDGFIYQAWKQPCQYRSRAASRHMAVGTQKGGRQSVALGAQLSVPGTQ